MLSNRCFDKQQVKDVQSRINAIFIEANRKAKVNQEIAERFNEVLREERDEEEALIALLL